MEGGRAGGSLKSMRAADFLHRCVGGSELRGPFSINQGAIKQKKCAILKVQKENPNHSNLQIILI